MELKLMDCTGYRSEDPARHAAALLIFAKNTRLEMDPSGFFDAYKMDYEKVLEELGYICRTIPSAWEFINYTVLIRGVSRGFTHQLVRTRTASFAQQTMRVLEMDENFDYYTGPTISDSEDRSSWYDSIMETLGKDYKALIKMGAKAEDARGILPTNIKTNIMVNMNLRTVAEMICKRSSPRVQGEYREFIQKLRTLVVAIHPWADMFLTRNAENISKEINRIVAAMQVPGPDEDELEEMRVKLWKLIDQLRMV